jgi:hypothetical protein
VGARGIEEEEEDPANGPFENTTSRDTKLCPTPPTNYISASEPA